MMKTLRKSARWMRTLLAAAGACLALGAASEEAALKLVVPSPPGGTIDTTARLIAHKLTTQTGQTVVIEHRTGAGSVLAGEYVARAPADGRTMMMVGAGLTYVPLTLKMPFSALDELAPVVQLTREYFALVTHVDSRLTSVKDIEREAAQGRPLSCAAGPGPTVIACDQLRAKFGPSITTVPYPGVAPSMVALLGGHVDFLFVNLEAVVRQAGSGKLRVLARTGGGGEAFGSVPLLSKVWPDLLLESNFGIMVPIATPKARIQQLNREWNAALADPQVMAAIRRDGAQEPIGGTPERYGAELRSVGQRYGEIIRRLDLVGK
jgi:tripartite-type tricarboxylate transporter receptor subunit TctC